MGTLSHISSRSACAETARAEGAARDGATFGLCLVALDHFKNINLSHGPVRGDDALRDIARRLVRTTLAGVEPSDELRRC